MIKLNEIHLRPLEPADFPLLAFRKDCDGPGRDRWELWERPERMDAWLLENENGLRVYRLPKEIK